MDRIFLIGLILDFREESWDDIDPLLMLSPESPSISLKNPKNNEKKGAGGGHTN